MSQKEVILYTTENCHLCETAQEIIRLADLTVMLIDIVDDDHLYNKYAMRIPVLQRTDTLAELDWPFNTERVMQFLF